MSLTSQPAPILTCYPTLYTHSGLLDAIAWEKGVVDFNTPPRRFFHLGDGPLYHFWLTDPTKEERLRLTKLWHQYICHFFSKVSWFGKHTFIVNDSIPLYGFEDSLEGAKRYCAMLYFTPVYFCDDDMPELRSVKNLLYYFPQYNRTLERIQDATRIEQLFPRQRSTPPKTVRASAAC